MTSEYPQDISSLLLITSFKCNFTIEAVSLFPAVDILWLLSLAYTASEIYACNYVQVTIIQLSINAVILATSISAAILWVL